MQSPLASDPATPATAAAASYPWDTLASPASKTTMLETRRRRLMDIMQEFANEGDQGQLTRLAVEWNKLTEARDRHIRAQFTREQTLQKAEKVLALRTMLEDLCDESVFEGKGEDGVKLGIYGLLARVKGFCTSQGITLSGTLKLRKEADAYNNALKTAEAVTAPPPPPPLPPPPPPMPVAAPRPKLNLKGIQNAGALKKTKVQFRTPLKERSGNDLMAQLNTANRGMLKQTPYKLSPGGTPAKGSKFETTDPITAALRAKFKNVNMSSPLVASPYGASPAALESSGSTPYAEPVFFIDHSAPKPQLQL